MHFYLASIRISFLDCVMMQCFKLQVQTKFEVGIRLLYPSFTLNYSSNLLFGKFLAQLDCITSHPRIISWCTSLSERGQRSKIHMLVSFHFEFLAPTGAQGVTLSVRLSSVSLSRAVNLHHSRSEINQRAIREH